MPTEIAEHLARCSNERGALVTEVARLCEFRELLGSAVAYPPEKRDGLLWYGFTPEFDARVRDAIAK